jgi:hypothetical protein
LCFLIETDSTALSRAVYRVVAVIGLQTGLDKGNKQVL